VSLPQHGVETRLANGTSFAAVALAEVMTAGRTIEIRSCHRVVARVSFQWCCRCAASGALLPDGLFAAVADASHWRLRIGENWIAPTGAVNAGTNRSLNAVGQTTAKIRVAMQPPLKVAVVRGVSVLITLWRSVLLLALQKLIDRFAD
jgi:hypothetical protein